MKSSFHFSAQDWLTSPHIALMTPEQEGAYIRLLCYDWTHDGIPDNDDQLAVLSRLNEGWFKGGSTVIRVCFTKHATKDGFITNERLQIERKRLNEWIEKSKTGGVSSGESRRCKFSKGGSKMVEPKSKGASHNIGIYRPNGLNKPQAAVEPPAKGGSTTLQKDSEADKGINADHSKLIAEWCECYERQFCTAYKFQGGRDGKAVKELLMGGRTVQEVMGVATAAWAHSDKFNCKNCVTLGYLSSKWNEVNAELARNGNAVPAESKDWTL